MGRVRCQAASKGFSWFLESPQLLCQPCAWQSGGISPRSKKMIALRQAYSLSSIWMSRKGFTNSSKILVATRAISSSGQCIGMMKSFPGKTREIPHQVLAPALVSPSSYPKECFPVVPVLFAAISSLQLYNLIHE